MGNEQTQRCAQTLTLDDIESTSGQYPLNADAKRMSLDSIETRPNLKPMLALNTSKKANKSTHNYIDNGHVTPTSDVTSFSDDGNEPSPTNVPTLRATNSNPSLHQKPSHNRSQSTSPAPSIKIKPIKSNKHKKRKSKSHKKRSKQKRRKSKHSMNSNMDCNTKIDSKYTAQEIEKEYLKKQNEELKRQIELLRSRFRYNLSTMSHIDEPPQIHTQQKSTPIDMPSYQRTMSPKKLKLSNAPTPPQRPILHQQRNDKKRVYDAMISPLVAPLPVLEPIYSKDDGDQFEQHIKLKERGSGKGRFFSDGNIISTDSKKMKRNKMEQEYHDNTEQENIWNMYFDGECANIKECIAVQRMIRALKWYSKLNGNADNIWKKIKDKQYRSNLINDYHHVMHYHLNKMDTMDMKREKMMICDEINKIVNKCDIKSCKGYKRKQSDLNNQQSEHIPFYVGCIDTIHCYFMHFDALQPHKE